MRIHYYIESLLPLFVVPMYLVGPSINRAIAKVASLFLAAISVAMIRAGIVAMVHVLK